MDKVRYSIYALYTEYGHLYIGMSKNSSLRVYQHFQKSSNPTLRKLIENSNIEIYSEILVGNLTEQEAEEYEKYLIAYYRADGMSLVLNIQDGGMGGSVWGENHAAAKISDEAVVRIRQEYKSGKSICQLSNDYEVSETTIHNIVTGKRSPHLAGPISTNNLDRCIHRKLTDDDVYKIRQRYSKSKDKIIFKEEAKQYNITGQHLSRLLRGVASPHVAGPLLGKDYKW